VSRGPLALAERRRARPRRSCPRRAWRTPFPRAALKAIAERTPDAELVWAQEEPRNMGPWPFLLQRFEDLGWTVRYAGRPMSSSPATGSYRRHAAEQEYLVKRALG
jgi:2-oxoglutarate decarboxylase